MPDTRYQRRISWRSFAPSVASFGSPWDSILIATAAKLIVDYSTGSLSLIADGFDSAFDSATNVIGLVGIYLAAQPADEAHALVSLLEERARTEIPHLVELTSHIEPRGQLIQTLNSDLEETQVAQAVQQVTDSILNGEACHRVQVRRSDAGWAVSMHCYLPAEMPLAEAHRISTRLEMQLLRQVHGLERVMIHTEPWDDGAASGSSSE